MATLNHIICQPIIPEEKKKAWIYPADKSLPSTYTHSFSLNIYLHLSREAEIIIRKKLNISNSCTLRLVLELRCQFASPMFYFTENQAQC